MSLRASEIAQQRRPNSNCALSFYNESWIAFYQPLPQTSSRRSKHAPTAYTSAQDHLQKRLAIKVAAFHGAPVATNSNSLFHGITTITRSPAHPPRAKAIAKPAVGYQTQQPYPTNLD